VALIAVNAIWEYQEVANDIPADPSAVTVPASSWTAGGVAPFGTWTPEAGLTDPNTSWTVDTGLWIRRNVVLNGLQAVELVGFPDNRAYVYFDGIYVGSHNGLSEFSFVVPMELCTAGTHSVAVLAIDEGVQTYISLEADYLPVLLPFQPRAPVREQLAWLTDVQIAKDGTEERTQFRIKARQELRFVYPVDSEKMRRAFLLAYDQRHEQWSVPVWTQATNVGAVAEGAQAVDAPGEIGDYRVGEYALLWQSPTVWQVVTVSALGSTTVDFSEYASEFDNAWVMPLRLGFLNNNPSKVFTGSRAEYEMTFQIEDNVDLAPAAPTQYLGEDIYFDESLLSGDSLSDDIIGMLELQDEDLGVVKYYAPWLNAKVARTHRVLAEGPGEAWALREWLYRRAGRFRGFWQPSFEPDLRCLSTGALTTTLIVANDGYLVHGLQRTHIAVETTTGWLARQITAAVASGANVQLTLNTSLGINTSVIKRISWLGFKRLNSDNIELNWPGAGICEADMRLLELNG
jgi:hypothetical protein